MSKGVPLMIGSGPLLGVQNILNDVLHIDRLRGNNSLDGLGHCLVPYSGNEWKYARANALDVKGRDTNVPR
jgi:hypothetical protein